ncbi:UDP-2,3-diacylglucosamine diphosphatase [Thiohalobacter sp. IOR34]|uniref:UDP-2,3-diacylglucosamine diphosphatase n=1 Tax=Thiohalobacter sp. IOR34 TaxID=3057176 RepID=UPI0025AEFC7D|nr:UDP-2,3-diacylglucosamine diphosphatase [Thiohalobacter sp. IOR34]WJW74504.1 UDP-2,3-diacylglucosamine diphosphatase [Thiohalobacter sp. IOR34]
MRAGHLADTLFIADLHLDPQRPAVTALFENFVDALTPVDCAALYILGDLFEAWIGDDEDQPEARRVIERLRALSDRGVPLYLLRGNRDFLLGEGFERDSGGQLLNEPALIDLYGEPTLLLHGDSLCTDDLDYQRFRQQVRDPDWQHAFLARPLAERRAIAAGLRETSREQTAVKQAEIMDVNPQAVASLMREHGVRRLIHGHTHRPAIHEFALDGAPATRMVLGDWYEQGSLLRCGPGGCRLESLPLEGGNPGMP